MKLPKFNVSRFGKRGKGFIAMCCPHCGYGLSRVKEKVNWKHRVRRRRECLGCGERFTTHETVARKG